MKWNNFIISLEQSVKFYRGKTLLALRRFTDVIFLASNKFHLHILKIFIPKTIQKRKEGGNYSTPVKLSTQKIKAEIREIIFINMQLSN